MARRNILRAYEKMVHPGEVQLIGIGWHPAKPAGDLQVGDVIVYSYGNTARVVKVEGIKGRFITFWTESLNDRGSSTRASYRSRRRIDSLVGFDGKASVKEAL